MGAESWVTRPASFACLVVLAVVGAARSTDALQEQAPADDGGAVRAGTGAPSSEPRQSSEDEEALALLREVADKDLDGARELLRDIVAGLVPPPVGTEKVRIGFLHELNRMAITLGSLQDSLTLCSSILELGRQALPKDHPTLLDFVMNLGAARYELRDFAGAQELFEELLAGRRRSLPEGHPEVLAAKQNLALTRKELGDLRGARELEEAVLAARALVLSAEDPLRIEAQQNLAQTLRMQGDLEGSHELFEQVLEVRTRLLPAEHLDLLKAKLNAAVSRGNLGDLAGKRALEEEVLAIWSRQFPGDHPYVLVAKQNLALSRHLLGDLAGARELDQELLAARTRLLPKDHRDLLSTKNNLAAVLRDLGQVAEARVLFEEVLETRVRVLPKDHLDILKAKQNVATTLYDADDLAGALPLVEEVLAARERLLPKDHPDILAAKVNLGGVLELLGEGAKACQLAEEVLAARSRLFPADYWEVLEAEVGLANARASMDDLAGTRETCGRLLAGMRARARELRAEARRPAREGVRVELRRFSYALHFGAAADPEHTLTPALFATLQNLRLVSAASAETGHALALHPELATLAARAAEARAGLNDLAAGGPARMADGGESADALESWRGALLARAEERDRSERELRAKLAEAGAFVGEIEAADLGARLARATAAVSFLRYVQRSTPVQDCLLAFVVRPGGAVQRIELGPAAELEEFVQEWRAALGRPLQGRGLDAGADSSGEDRLAAAGAKLRERVLDPVLAAAGDVHALHLDLDDFLYLVPFDALPLGTGLVGERISIRNESTLARLLRAESARAAAGGLTLAGALDYDAEPGTVARTGHEASTPPLERSGRVDGAPGGFAFLPGTGAEAEAIAALYEQAFQRKPGLLTRAAGTKAALHAAAPGTRYLHLATHGWFASESSKSQLDASREPGARDLGQRAEETLTGFAPETLCGLALAGANRGRDALGRVPGILTAEELASFDLRSCELAVLSACETNVGVRRAGQGIQSLQSALHAAGARTAITSLWKVDDDATRRLFERFYSGLWQENLGKAGALWRAKMELRAEGRPARDWAGWVLSGDPD